MSEFISTAKLAGQYGFCAVLVYFGYQLLSTNPPPSLNGGTGALLMIVGVILGIYII